MSLVEETKQFVYNAISSILARRDLGRLICRARKTIDNPTVKVVSFDIFDTLLSRLSYQPQDVFYLALRRWEGETNANLFTERCHAEIEMSRIGYLYPTLDEIWHYIGAKCNLTEEQVKQLSLLEIQTEKELIGARKPLFELYEYAIRSGKRVIIVSDMYLSSIVLSEILSHVGYRLPDHIYVSCECKGTKANGKMFDYVLRREAVSKPSQVFHVGDNIISDGWKARKKGMQSLCIQSAYQRFSYSASGAKRFMRNQNLPVQERFLFGHVLNACEEDGGLSFKKNGLSLSLFSKAILFPLLYRIDEYIIDNEEIQNNYNEIYFISRDGKLPMEGYQLMRNYLGHGLAPVYLYGSRLLFKQHEDNEEERLISEYYQNTIRLKNGRAVVYDIGYGGSVSKISYFFNSECKIDKIYLWQNEVNRSFDRRLQTRSFVLFNGTPRPFFTFLEAVFTRLDEGSAVGISREHNCFIPVCSPINCEEQSRQAVDKVHSVALSLLKSYLPYKVNNHIPDLDHGLFWVEWMQHYFGHTISSASCLKGMVYEDPLKVFNNTTSLDRHIRVQRRNENRIIYFFKTSIASVYRRYHLGLKS